MQIEVERLPIEVPEDLLVLDRFISICGNSDDSWETFRHKADCSQQLLEDAWSCYHYESVVSARGIQNYYRHALYFAWLVANYLDHPIVADLLYSDSPDFMDELTRAHQEFRKHFTEDVTKLVQPD